MIDVPIKLVYHVSSQFPRYVWLEGVEVLLELLVVLLSV